MSRPVQAPVGVFRSRREIVTVDAIVRDKSGAIVRGLTADDFEIREDGRPQQVLNFSFEEIKDKAPATIETADLLAGVEAKLQEQTRSPSSAAAAAAAAPADVPTSESMAGRRLITLLFDVSSMQPDDVQRAVDSAQKYVSEKMSNADMVSVVTVSSSLNVLTDFTADRGKVAKALTTLGYADGTAVAPPDASTAATDEAAAAAADDAASDTSDLDMFNNDIRLARAQDGRRHAGADRAEEGNHLLQRRACSAAGRTIRSSSAPQSTPPFAATSPSTPSTPAASRRSCPGETRQAKQAGANAMFSSGAYAPAVRHAQRLAGHADLAGRRHRGPRLHGHQRLR